MQDLVVHDQGSNPKLSVFTIGHGKHPIEKFIALLREHGVEVLVDARSQPFSRFSPQFSRKALERAVIEASIRYLFMGDLLGGRPQPRECYDAAGKVDYDRVEAQLFYQRGIERLLDGIARFRVGVLCAEEDPARCHRRLLIARTLVRRGVEVLHIRGSGTVQPEAELGTQPPTPQLGLPITAAVLPKGRTDTASLVIAARPDAIYRAFSDPDALMAWLPPGDMAGRALEYDFREGGRYRIELTYGDAAPPGAGKTTERADITSGRFLCLKPGQRIVQSVEFDSADASFAGEMVMTWTFDSLGEGTRVTVAAQDVPSGITKADHDAGLRSSLENLERYVGRDR